MTNPVFDNLPFIAGGLVVALIAWLMIRSRSSAPNKFMIPQFMFTRIGSVIKLKAESVVGVMISEHHGGQKEDSAAVAIHRKGRLWYRPSPNRDHNTLRHRELIYVTRQNDSSVLNLKSLFHDGDTQLVGKLTQQQLKPIRDLATRRAMAEAVEKPSQREMLTRVLSATAAISVVLGGISWIALEIKVLAG